MDQTLAPVGVAVSLQPTDDNLDRLSRVEETLRRWHNDAHDGAFKHCYEQPCCAVRRAMGVVE